MPASSSTLAQSSRAHARRAAPAPGAIALLKQDHKEVAGLADLFERARAPRRKEIAAQICRMLTIHATIEEEIFYPAVRQVADDELEAMLNEATVEHESVKQLVSEIEDMLQDSGEQAMLEARVKVLAEYVKHHVREEEREMFPLVRDTGLDLKALGARLAERKAALERR
jgi:hemerythrin superfamily protein